MADADVVAVLALAAGFLDDAGAGGEDGCTGRCRPVDAGMHAPLVQQRVEAHAETRGEADVAAHRPAHQELFRIVAPLVVVVDEAVGRPEAIEPVRLAAGGDRREQELARRAVRLRVVLHVEEELDVVAGADAAAKIRLRRMDLHHLVDRVGRNVLQKAGVVDAGVHAGCRGPIVVVDRGVGDLFPEGGRLASDELARCVARDGDEMVVAVGEYRVACRLLLVALGQRRNERDTHLLTRGKLRLGEDVACGLDHAARRPGIGARPLQDLAQRVAFTDAYDLRLAAFQVGELVVGLGRFHEHGGVGGHGVGALGAERQSVLAGSARRIGFGAGTDHLSLCLRRLGGGDVLNDLRFLELLSVLRRQDAAEQLDDVDDDVALVGGVRLVLFAGIDRLRGVKVEGIEGRHLLLERPRRDGRKARDDARVGLGVDVLAAEAPLLDGLVDDVARGDGAAGYLQAVALRRRPLEAGVVTPEWVVVPHEIGFAELGQPGQEPRLAFRLVDRSVDHHENGNGADRAGKAGADQPAEAADLAALGMVRFVEVLEGARRPAAIELRQPVLPLRSGQRAKASMMRIAAAIDHDGLRPSPRTNSRDAPSVAAPLASPKQTALPRSGHRRTYNKPMVLRCRIHALWTTRTRDRARESGLPDGIGGPAKG